ncbi:hypothetical protein AAG597_13520, partial [Citromicrobium bathyomarinum]
MNDNGPATDDEEVRLTGVLTDIARVAGRDAAIAIARKFGGVRMYFPLKPSKDSWLVKTVGQ